MPLVVKTDLKIVLINDITTVQLHFSCRNKLFTEQVIHPNSYSLNQFAIGRQRIIRFVVRRFRFDCAYSIYPVDIELLCNSITVTTTKQKAVNAKSKIIRMEKLR